MPRPSPQLAALLVRLGDLTGEAARPSSLPIELTRAAAAVRQLFDAAACSVALVEGDGDRLRFVASVGVGSDAVLDRTLPVSRGIAGWAVMAGQPIAVSDVVHDQRFARDVAEATHYIPDVIFAVPLVGADDSPVGVMELLDPQVGGSDSGQVLRIFATVADQVAATVRFSSVFDSLGRALLSVAARAGDDESFDEALAELAGAKGSDPLLAVAETFNRLASRGPRAAVLAQKILNDVAAFARAQR